MVIEADVCRTNSVSNPSSAPIEASQATMSAVTSTKPAPRVATAMRPCTCSISGPFGIDPPSPSVEGTTSLNAAHRTSILRLNALKDLGALGTRPGGYATDLGPVTLGSDLG